MEAGQEVAQRRHHHSSCAVSSVPHGSIGPGPQSATCSGSLACSVRIGPDPRGLGLDEHLRGTQSQPAPAVATRSAAPPLWGRDDPVARHDRSTPAATAVWRLATAPPSGASIEQAQPLQHVRIARLRNGRGHEPQRPDREAQPRLRSRVERFERVPGNADNDRHDQPTDVQRRWSHDPSETGPAALPEPGSATPPRRASGGRVGRRRCC